MKIILIALYLMFLPFSAFCDQDVYFHPESIALLFRDLRDPQRDVKVEIVSHVGGGTEIGLEDGGRRIDLGKEALDAFRHVDLRSVEVNGNQLDHNVLYLKVKFLQNLIPGWEHSGKSCLVRFKFSDGLLLSKTVFVSENGIVYSYKGD